MMRAETPCAQEETGRRLSTVKMCLSHFPLSNLDWGSGYRLWHTHRHTQPLQPATDAQLTSQSITKGENMSAVLIEKHAVCVRACTSATRRPLSTPHEHAAPFHLHLCLLSAVPPLCLLHSTPFATHLWFNEGFCFSIFPPRRFR